MTERIIDIATGEDRTDKYLTPILKEDYDKYLDNKKIKENIEFWKNRTPDICGKFFWIPYTPGVSLSKELSNLDSATLARFLFCCSYRSADGFLTKSSRKDGKPLAPKDLQALMGLSDSAARKCFKPLFENGLLILRDGSIYPNPEVISRGNIKQTKYDVNSKKIRGFYNGIQTLFEKCRDPRQHKAVGYIYKLIPWVNINYNILCSNPLEDELDKIVPLSTKEILTILGLATDKPKQFFDGIAQISPYIFLAPSHNANMLGVHILLYYGGSWDISYQVAKLIPYYSQNL